jgi:aspartate/methionine/tyrosine aminotransferase
LTAGRDGFPANASNIYLSAGASSGVNTLLHVICAGPKTGVLVPIPQYPLYTATLAVLDAQCVPYYLDEAKAWGTNLESLRSALHEARAKGTDVRALVVINPGNPTGASLPKADIHAVLRLAAEERLVVIADEVYQTNVFVGEFHSFKKCLRELQADPADGSKFAGVELASLHSISKGMIGECGQRGGYFELVGFDPAVEAQIFKFISIMLCPPVLGQCMVECMVNPPREGETSYALYRAEYDAIYKGLKERATALYEAFKQMEGVECQEPQVRVSPWRDVADFDRAPCTSSRRSRCPRRPSRPRRPKRDSRTSSTASGCSMPRACAWFQARDSARRKARSTSGRHSWRRERSGSAGLPSSTRSSWMSSGDGPADENDRNNATSEWE